MNVLDVAKEDYMERIIVERYIHIVLDVEKQFLTNAWKIFQTVMVFLKNGKWLDWETLPK